MNPWRSTCQFKSEILVYLVVWFGELLQVWPSWLHTYSLSGLRTTAKHSVRADSWNLMSSSSHLQNKCECCFTQGRIKHICSCHTEAINAHDAPCHLEAVAAQVMCCCSGIWKFLIADRSSPDRSSPCPLPMVHPQPCLVIISSICAMTQCHTMCRSFGWISQCWCFALLDFVVLVRVVRSWDFDRVSEILF